MAKRSVYLRVGVAIVSCTTLVLLPDLAAGTLEITKVIAALAWVSADGWILARTMRWGQRRQVATAWTLAVGYALVVAFGAIGLGLVTATGLVARHAGASTRLPDSLADGAFQSFLALGIWGLLYVIPRAVDDERRRQELRREAEHARVRAALEPHFVVNTLTAIGGLVGSAPDTARELLGDLGDLLRDAVQLADRELQCAADEIAWLQRYVRVMEARHRGRFAVEWHIDPEVEAVLVPVLVLQPLVENAIQHGALGRARDGRIRVELRLVAGALRCTIEDNGPGLRGELRDGAHGVSLTRRRLASVAPGASLALDSDSTGTRATVTIPRAA